MQNEDGMFFWTMDAMKPEQKRLLGRKFASWLVQKYGSLDDARDAWKDETTPGDGFKSGDVAILSVGLWTRPQRAGLSKRLDDQLQFFAETQRNFYAMMVKFYRDELGCRQLINASNWITADPVRLNDVERYTDTAADVLAVNKYFTGIHDGKNSGWRVDPGDHFTNHPAVLNPWDLPTNLKQVVGHPMIVTETTWVSPMDFQNEGPFLAAAYQSLTGVAGCYWFTATADQYEDDPRLTFLDLSAQHPLRKWTCSTPNLMGNFPAAALMYRSGYIQRGRPVVTENRPLADLWNRRMPLIAEDPTFDSNRNSGELTTRRQTLQGVSSLAFLVGPVTVNYGGDPSRNFVADLSSFIDTSQKTVTSSTGQIRMNYNQGVCTIDAPGRTGRHGIPENRGKNQPQHDRHSQPQSPGVNPRRFDGWQATERIAADIGSSRNARTPIRLERAGGGFHGEGQQNVSRLSDHPDRRAAVEDGRRGYRSDDPQRVPGEADDPGLVGLCDKADSASRVHRRRELPVPSSSDVRDR